MDRPPLTLQEAIRKATEKLARAGVTTARLDAEVLLAHILQKDRTWVFTHNRDSMDGAHEALFEKTLDRRARREPLQYITGKQEFWGLEFKVTPDVLIPRPETELVVESTVNFLKNAAQPRLIDLCTGSGCIAVSLAKEFPRLLAFATDMSARALTVAKQNARKHGVSERVRFFEGDLLQPLAEPGLRGQADVITANPPYIPSKDLPSLQPEVGNFEPEMALIAGAEGTEFHRRIIADARPFLKQNGALIMEMGLGQAEALIEAADAAGGYGKPQILKDLAGIDRVIIVTRK